MLKINTLFILITLFFSTCNSKKVKTPADNPRPGLVKLSKQIFETIKSEDENAYMELMPEKEDFYSIGNEKFRRRLYSEFDRIKDNSRKSFHAILKEAQKAGIEWKKVKLDSIGYRTYNRIIGNDTIPNADVTIQFKQDILPYQVKLKHITRPDKKWLMGDKIIWEGAQPYKIEE